MSDLQSIKMSNPEIDDNDVMEWLKNHPDFLSRNPEALDLLNPPKDQTQGRKVADFQHYLVQKLRDDKASVLENTRELVEISRENMSNVSRIHDAALKVLEAHDFQEFVHIIVHDLSPILGTDMAILVVESSEHDATTLHTGGIRVVPQGTIDQWMGGQSARLHSNMQGNPDIYAGGATLIQSEALLRVDISMKTPPAILAFGSRDPEFFRDGQGTEMVGYLARVVERCFRLWLDLPHS